MPVKYFYTVIVASLAHSKMAIFTYHHDKLIPSGAFVRVPVGRTKANGVILKKVPKPSFPTKPILEELHQPHHWPKELLSLAKWISDYYAAHLGLTLQSMIPSGIHKKRREPKPPLSKIPTRQKKDIKLTSAQQAAVNQIGANSSGQQLAFLLHGVPGSGKTQVYIEACKQAINSEKSAIVLVPEIALTTQLIAELSQHFNTVVIHSSMTESERHQTWSGILSSRTPLVVVGPRSALFSPLRNIGLIIVDECHEQSFKQDRTPRYHAVYAASMLAKLHKAKLVLGSATPNTTELMLAQEGRMTALNLPEAIQPHKNQVQIVPHSKRELFTAHRFISNALLQAIKDSLSNNKQTLIFHNRRGTTPAVLCESCGWQALCPECQMPLTYHQDQQQLRCHSCNFSQKILYSCPECRAPTIVFKGIGTKLVESELRKLFSHAKIARFDTDNAKDEQLQHRYQELYDGKIDIIIGTQILAKGLDLPGITTVGVLQADAGLMLPDFTAHERTFQLLYQVIGRAGRAEREGQVILQTYLPNHELIQLAAKHDFANFYASELARRQRGNLPPYCFLLKLTYGGKKEQTVISNAKTFAQEIYAKYPQVKIVGPAPAFREQQHGLIHWQIIVKSKKRPTLQAIAAAIPANWTADLDPVSLL